MQASSDVSSTAPLQITRYRGEAVYLYAFDVAYEMARRPVVSLLGQPVAEFVVDASKRSPKQLFFYRPQMVRLPALERIGPRGPVRVERTVKLLPVGAISIACSVPFDVEDARELVEFHDLSFVNASLQDEVRELAEEIRRELAPYFIRPVDRLADEEAYTVFCIESPGGDGSVGATFCAEDWLENHRDDVAALLTQEPEPGLLSRQESQESTARHLSYYRSDLVVVDWDAALIIDERRNFAESLYLMEIANLQLAELEAYDRLLDDSLDRAYRDLRSQSLKSRASVLRELRELRVDLARFSDELSNITKFFGDWHLARTYQALSARLHLGDWHQSIDKKLQTLDELYGLLAHDRMNGLMLILEITIVLLFIVDLILIFVHLK